MRARVSVRVMTDYKRLSVLDILRAGDEMGRDTAGVAGTLRGVPGTVPDHTAPQSAARARVYRRALRCRLSSVLRPAHQLYTPGRLYHGGPAWSFRHRGRP